MHLYLRILSCYTLHSHDTLLWLLWLWTPIDGEFVDYIVNPKPSGYQSLHTAVQGLDNSPLEVQMRTQRAKIRWLCDGDRNTRYFHLCASNKRRHNLISSLSVSGSTLSDWGAMAVAFRDFYVDLLGRNVYPLLQPRWTALFQPAHDELHTLESRRTFLYDRSL
ncbi:GTP diphosphokinase RSH3 precursor [Canna indica]|uniref:GTP diphosphokinase RSH3 n=1 Tax=Canna indica TaxID=4628 RepID=A0AAQ3KXU5_9LILI|nr:GTP diphosphokinase RSH3 precursor [Canna indica]